MRQSLRWLRSFPLITRATRLSGLALLSFLAGWQTAPAARAAVIPLESVRPTNTTTWWGGAVDPATGKFYERNTFDTSGVVRVYNDSASYEAGVVASIVTQNPRGFSTYFSAQGGKLFQRSTSGGWYGEPASRHTEVQRWDATTGLSEAVLGAVPFMGGANNTHTFNWGGFSAANVLNDNGQLYILGKRTDGTGWELATLNADMTIASTRTINLPFQQGYAFVMRGKLFAGGTYLSSSLQRMVDLATGEITTVSHSFSGPAAWYITNAFYDAAADVLYLYNRSSGLHRLQHAAANLGLANSPVADAGRNRSVLEGALVTLSAEASQDQNTPPQPLSFAWTQLSGVPVTLENADTATPSFVAPEVPPAGAVLTFQVTVSNGISDPVQASVTISVGNVNIPPVADAGAPQLVPEGSTVLLEGDGSDADGDNLTWSWTQKSGPAVELLDANTPNPSFIAPAVAFQTGSLELVFSLVVNDGHVNSGASDVAITVVNTNAPPVAHAGENQSVNELEAVSLDGSLSLDADGDSLSYSWEQIGGEPIVALNGAATATPSFVAPSLDLGGSDEGTTLTFQLTVSDGELSSTSSVNVRVSNVNHPPVADAGEEQTVPENTLVALDGSGSEDTDGDPLTYSWTQIDTGYPVTLSDPASANPEFTTPDVGVNGALLRFKLTVDDGYGGEADDEVVIRVTYANRAPVADAGGDAEAEEGSVVIVPGQASDPDGNEVEYRWIQVSGPQVDLLNAFSATTTFVAPAVTMAGDTVVLQLIASDLYGGEAMDEIAIAITNVNRPPVATAPANLTVSEGAPVELIGQGTDPDVEEQGGLVYQWQLIAPIVEPAVAGHVLTFVAPTLDAGGAPDASLTLTLRFTVTDPSGASSTADVDVVVTNTPTAPIAIASAPEIADEATAVTLNGMASSSPDGDPLSFAWVQTGGPAVTLDGATTATPQFTAPFVNAGGAALTFQLTVQNAFGASSSDEVTVSVRNTNDAPIVETARPSVASLWPADHRMVSVTILDVIDANATVRITGVTQDEKTSGDGGGDVPVDAIISEDGTSVLLRAERSPTGDGRVYRVAFVAEDFEHSVPGVVRVIVPKTKKSGAVEGSASFDSTVASSGGSSKPAPTLKSALQKFAAQLKALIKGHSSKSAVRTKKQGR